jgi:hypothetical protein
VSKHNPGDLVLYRQHADHAARPDLVCLVVDVKRDVLGAPKRDQLLLVCTTGEPWTSWCDESHVKPL